MIGQKGRFIREIRAVLNDYYSQLKKQNLRHGDKHLKQTHSLKLFS